MSLFSMPIRIKSTQRLGHIAFVFTKHGLGFFINQLKLDKHIPLASKLKKKTPKKVDISLGKRLVAIFEELGPTFIKFGQMLSSRPDLIPPDLLEDLKALQDKVRPFPLDEVHRIIKKELGKETDKIFEYFSEEPLASGSIAQTHLARTKDARDVIVKIKRPSIDEIIRLDIYILYRIAESIEKHIPELTIYRPTQIVEEFEQTITKELDLLNEATITDKICQLFKDRPDIIIPSVRWEFTTKNIITMSYIKGIKIYDALKEYKVDRIKIAQLLIDAFMEQSLKLGIFHADPHPGNILIIPPDRIALVDFGMAGTLDKKRINELVMILISGYYKEMNVLVSILEDMDAIDETTDKELLKRDILALINKYQMLPIKYLDFQEIFSQMAALARKHKLKLPRDLVMVAKSLISIAGTAYLLAPQLNLTSVVRPHIQKAIINTLSKENIKRQIAESSWIAANIIKNLPLDIKALTKKAIKGEFTTRFESIQLEELTKEIDKSSNRLSFAIIIASIIIGSSIIFHAKVGPVWNNMPLLGLTGYLIAAVMGLWLAVAILRSGKLG